MENRYMKKTYKLLISIILVFIALLIFSAKESNAATATVDGTTWTYTLSGGKATKVYTTKTTLTGTLTIPSQLGGYDVTTIGSGSRNIFNQSTSTSNTKITSIVIPSTVTQINTYAFNRFTKLESVSGMENVTTIGGNAFYNCTTLKSITIPESVKSIGASAFYGCTALTQVNFSEGLNTIGISAFYNCKALTAINFPNTLTSIGNNAFKGCTALTGDLVIPSGVATLGTNCFENCTGLNGNLIINSSDLIAIPNYAFNGCTNFSKITLPSTVKSVGSYAFDGQKDIYVDGAEGDINFSSNFGGTNIPYIHYRGCTHKLSASTLDGIKIVNADTGDELTEIEVPCESSINLSLQIEGGYNYDNLVVIKTRSGDYVNSENVSEQVEGTTITIDKITRDTTITTQNISNGLDLVLRKYISNINGNDPDVSRAPKISIASVSPKYLHTKYPLIVETNDLITYTIKVYNKGSGEGNATLITEHLPEGLEFVKDNDINNNYRWQASDDGRTLTTDYLKDTLLAGYTGIGQPSSGTIQVVCKVTAEKDDTKVVRLTNVSEISAQSSADANSTPANFTTTDLSKYKYDEAINSNSASYIEGQEDDDDFENVVILRKIPVTYTLKISKVDYATLELINGAKFDLLNEQREVIQSGVTVVDGTLTFEPITTYDGGVDTYYISETETPEGYEPTTESIIKIKIVKTILDKVTESYKIRVECDIIDSYVDTRIDESLVIPIYTAEQLSKMGSEETIVIDGESYTFSTDRNYRLMNNIDLSGSEWTPITKNLTGIFDGNNKTISGLTITDNTKKTVGLFAVYSGIIQNLNLEDVNINIDLSDKIAEIELRYTDKEEQQKALNELLDSYYVGGLVGKMQGGAILNSKVNGTIQSDSNSVGGFVGYADSGYLLIMKNCTNNSNVTSSSYNVGGLIGNSHSALTIKECTNNGAITAGKYNAGGLVGYEEATEYTSNSVRVEYDDKSDVINLVVRNSKVDQYYTIVLRKKDADTNDLIDGSRFSVYDSNKNVIVGLENVELTNGSLKLDPVKMESSGTDTYYLKEVSAPDGYDLIDEYIKVEINKSWDGTNSKYVLNSNNNSTSDDSENKDNNKDKVQVGTGANYTFVETDGISWLANKALVMNSVNNGKVTAELLNAAGMIAKTNCIVDVESSTNKGEIEATGNAAGILAEAERKDDNTTIDINECTNDGVIKIVPKSSTALGSASGIVSYSKAKTTIANSTNNANIVGTNVASAGIVANMEEELNINNCKNTGAIETADMASGILGKYLNRAKTATIENTTNEGSITGTAQTAGIASFVNSQKLTIKDSKNYKANLTNRGMIPLGGIVAFTTSDTEITNCSIEESDLIGGSEAESGILGFAGTANVEGKFESPTIVNIESCSAKSLNLTGASDVKTAIVGKIVDTQNGGIKNVNIKNCTSEDVTIVNESSNPKSDSLVAGFIQNATYLTIDNCDAKNSNIIVNNSGNYDSGLVVGMILQNGATDGATSIANCDIKNVKVSSSAVGHMGGIVGYIQGPSSGVESPIAISNCSVEDTDVIMTPSSYVDTAGILASVLYAKEIEISNCNVTNSKFEATPISNSYTSYGDSAGIAGMINASKAVGITDCNVTNSSFKSVTGKAAGIVGEIQVTSNGYGINFERCKVTDSQITGIDGEKGGNRSGGIAGQALTYNSDIIINDCEVKSTNETSKVVISGKNMMGSMIGYTSNNVKMQNSNASNIQFNSIGSDLVGGAFGMVGAVEAKNCKYENINISNHAVTGGFIGYTSGNQVSIDNCTFGNIDIDVAVNGYGYGTIGGVIAIAGSNVISNGSTYRDISISSKDNCTNEIGGIVGLANNEMTISNNTINDINIDSGRNGSYSGGIVGVAGGSGKLKIDNENISNITISTNYNAGGIIGVGTIYANSLSDENRVTLKNINITSTAQNPTIVGGVSAISSSSGSYKNINVNGITINTAGPQTRVAGIAAVDNDITINNCHVSGANISNSYDAGNSSNGDNNVGGIVGVSTRAAISNCSVTDSNIVAKNAAIGGIAGGSNANITNSNVTDTSVKATNYGYVGGILGHDNGNIQITSSDVTKGTITNGAGNTGGIAGYAAGTIQSSNLTNSNITAMETGSFGVGGIVGQGYNLKQYESSQYTKVKGCIVTNSNIAGYAAVGGIAGTAVPEITSCKVIGNKNTESKVDLSTPQKVTVEKQNVKPVARTIKSTNNSKTENKVQSTNNTNDKANTDTNNGEDTKNEVDNTEDTNSNNTQNNNGEAKEATTDQGTANNDDSGVATLSEANKENETSSAVVKSAAKARAANDTQKASETEENDTSTDESNNVDEGTKEEPEENVSDTNTEDSNTKEDVAKEDTLEQSNSTEVDNKLTEPENATKNKAMAKSTESVANDGEVNELSDTDEYSTTITGTTYVGGIIGYGGELLTPYHLAVTITDCQIENIKVEGTADVEEAIGKRSFYSDSYQGSLVDVIINFINTSSLVNIKQ